MARERAAPVRFAGYSKPTYTMVPDELFDEQLPHLSGAELKVLLYIMRRTFGFKKDSDEISFNQICRGITTRDGRVLDQGTGLSSSTAQLAIKSLVDKNLILAARRVSRDRGNEPTTYSLNLVVPYGDFRHSLPLKIDRALWRESPTQETVEQETVLQETGKSTHPQSFSYSDSPSNIRNTTKVDVIDTHEGTHPTPKPVSPPRSAARRDTRPDRVESSPAPKPPSAPPNASASTTPPGRPPKARRSATVSPDRQAIGNYLTDFSRELGDQAPMKASITRATRLYEQSGLDLEVFIQHLLEARALTKERSTVIRKRRTNASGRWTTSNKVPYFFAILEDLVGLREEEEPQAAPSPAPVSTARTSLLEGWRQAQAERNATRRSMLPPGYQPLLPADEEPETDTPPARQNPAF